MLKFVLAACVVATASAALSLPTGFNLTEFLDYGNLFCTETDKTCSNANLCCMTADEAIANFKHFLPFADTLTDVIDTIASTLGIHIDIRAQLALAGIPTLADVYGICRIPLLFLEGCETGTVGTCGCLPGLECKKIPFFPPQCHTGLIPDIDIGK